ncbi:MAG: 23S rRNA (uracil(1939)-C(5))-methyltransferase RlmD [Parachlamydiales bacterium]|nr:23S rRNA (uracil(1939)-C(5))-methyltransferase RlmD [Parachlamydiales bacterium]
MTADITIEGFLEKGEAFGTYSAPNRLPATVSVRGAMVGETVRVQLFRKRKGTYDAKLLDVLEPSKVRQKPRCIHFGQCGGCMWQHIPYEEQLNIKSDRINALFPYAKDKIKPIIGCDTPWNKRNKMEFSFGKFDSLGLYRAKSSGHIIDLNECHLCPEWFLIALNEARNWQKQHALPHYHPSSNGGLLRTLTLRHGFRTNEKMIILTVAGDKDFPQIAWDDFSHRMKKNFPDAAIFIRRHILAKGIPTRFEEIALTEKTTLIEKLVLPNQELNFTLSPMSFFQPNPSQAEQLYALALDMLELKGDETLYDLFCGTATLSLFAAQRVKKVIGVELNPEAVQDARRNAQDNTLPNVTIIEADVAKFLEDEPSIDCVLIDPPRCGLGPKAVEWLIKAHPKKILYISCNPYTQATDCLEFKKAGYKIQSIQPVDQFPNTAHCENIILLSK